MLKNILFFIKPLFIIFLLMGNLYSLELSIIPLKKPSLDKQTKEKKLSQSIIKPKSKPIKKTKETETKVVKKKEKKNRFSSS